jgi:hypothetical protein
VRVRVCACVCVCIAVGAMAAYYLQIAGILLAVFEGARGEKKSSCRGKKDLLGSKRDLGYQGARGCCARALLVVVKQ